MATVSTTQIDPRVLSFIEKPRKMLINNKWVDAVSGKTFLLRSIDRRGAGAGCRRRSRRYRSRGKSCAQSFRQGPVAQMTPSERGRTDLEARRPDRAALEEFALARIARQRQAADRCAGRRCAARRRTVPLHGGMGDQDRGQHHSVLGAIHARARSIQLHAARAGRRGRADHSVEFPAADGRVEARARRWPPGCTVVLKPAEQTPLSALRLGRADHGSRIPRRCGQHRPGLWRDRRRGLGRAPGCGQGRVHRLDGSRQTDRRRPPPAT